MAINKKSFMDESSLESYEQQRKLISERMKTIKSGENVIHLNYYGEIDKDVISTIETKLESHNLELSFYNRSGVFVSIIEDFSLDTYIVLTYPIIKELLLGISSDALWDTLKYCVEITKDNLRNKTLNKIQGDEVIKKNIKFGVKMKFDNNTQFDFELDGELDNETFLNSMDKILEFIKDEKFNTEYRNSKYIKFDKMHSKWMEKDFEEYLKSKRKNKYYH